MGQVPPFIAKVVVTVFSDEASLKEICEKLEPDFIQVHGGETACLLNVRGKLDGVRMIRAYNLQEFPLSAEASMMSGFDAVMLDSGAPDGYGGTGRILDWPRALELKERLDSIPTILAGGLNPANVAEAVRTVHPYAVDVSSGVEVKPGVKDEAKVRKFIAEAKRIS